MLKFLGTAAVVIIIIIIIVVSLGFFIEAVMDLFCGKSKDGKNNQISIDIKLDKNTKSNK